MDRVPVAIVGAGITGLTLAHYLRTAGVPHLVLEGSHRPGGVIRSARIDGHLLEWGPQRTRLTASIRDLVSELGLEASVLEAPRGLPLLVYRSGKLRRVPFSVAAFFTSDIVSLKGKLRVLAEPLTPGARADESVAAYFTRKLGRELYENIAGPLYGGLYASDPANMIVGLSLAHVLDEFGIRRSLAFRLMRRGGSVDPPAAISFVQGLETLPRALYSANESNILLNSPVRSLERSGSSWKIEHGDRSLLAERVVLTTPAGVTARILARVSPTSAEALQRLVYNPLAVVHLHAETTLVGLGFQVSLAERLATRGVTFNDCLFQRKGVYTAYLGGAKAAEVVHWRDDELGTVAVREFRIMTGFEARPLAVEREWMPAWDASWVALRDVSLPAGLRLATNWESRPGIPGRLAQAKRLAAEYAREFGGSVDPLRDRLPV